MGDQLIRAAAALWDRPREEGAVARPALITRQLMRLAPDAGPRVDIGSAITISAKSAADIYAAANCLGLAIEAGHLEDFTSFAPNRILRRWLQCPEDLLMGIAPLTPEERAAHFQHWCLTALEMGYNGLLIGEGFGYRAPARCEPREFLHLAAQLIAAARAHELEAGLDITRLGPPESELLVEFLASERVAAVFHGALAERFGKAEGLLSDERLLKGLTCVRALCPEHTLLVAHLIPPRCGSSETLPYLLARLPRRCALSFCAVGDEPHQLFGNPHPIWGAMRAKAMRGQLPLIPIFNPGQCGWGGGLWPTVPPVEWEGLLQRCIKERFELVIALTPRLPPKSGFLRAALWSFGQRLTWDLPMEDLLATWLAARRADWSLPKEIHLNLLQLSRALQKLTLTGARACDLHDIEHLRKTINLHRLRLRQWVAGPQLLECVHLFLTDARHLLIAALQEGVGAHQGTQYHALLQALLQEETGEEGMWTEIRGSGALARAGWRDLPLASKHRGAEHIAGDSGFADALIAVPQPVKAEAEPRA